MSLPHDYDSTRSRQIQKGLRTQEERDQVVSQVVRESAIKSLGVGASLVGISLLLNRRYTFWRKLRWPVKATVAIWGSLGSFAYFAEDTMTRKDIEYSNQFSKVAVSGASGSDSALERLPFSERLSWNDAKKYMVKNRYEIVGSAWLTTALGTILYLWRKPIPISDKLINARLYAQSLGLAGLFAFAFAAALKSDEESREDKASNDHFHAVLDQRN